MGRSEAPSSSPRLTRQPGGYTAGMILALSTVNSDLTFGVGGYRFGFMDLTHLPLGGPDIPYTTAFLGPLGSYRVPVSAVGGWLLTALLLAALFAAVAWLSLRRRKSSP
jgi:hypothetical protein